MRRRGRWGGPCRLPLSLPPPPRPLPCPHWSTRARPRTPLTAGQAGWGRLAATPCPPPPHSLQNSRAHPAPPPAPARASSPSSRPGSADGASSLGSQAARGRPPSSTTARRAQTADGADDAIGVCVGARAGGGGDARQAHCAGPGERGQERRRRGGGKDPPVFLCFGLFSRPSLLHRARTRAPHAPPLPPPQPNEKETKGWGGGWGKGKRRSVLPLTVIPPPPLLF